MKMKHYLKKLDCSALKFKKGIFDVPVPQAVDEGIQHGDDHSVHH
jgi:hypothetical protein